MLKIRLQRVGRKHEPVFRVVVTESTNSTKSGKFLEILGSYDARKKDRAVLKKERIAHWISKGAQPSETLHNLFIDEKIIEGKKINVLPRKSPIVKEVEENTGVTEEPKIEEEKTETKAPKVEAETPTEEAKTEAPAEEVVAEAETPTPEAKTE